MQPPLGSKHPHDRGWRAPTTTAYRHLAHDMRRLLACWMTSKYLLGTNDALGSSVVRDCRPGCRGSARPGHPYGWHAGRGDDPFDGTARCTPRPCTMVRRTRASRRLAAPSHGRLQTGHHPVGSSPGCYSCDPSVDADRAGCGRLAASPQPHPGLSVPSASWRSCSRSASWTAFPWVSPRPCSRPGSGALVIGAVPFAPASAFFGTAERAASRSAMPTSFVLLANGQ